MPNSTPTRPLISSPTPARLHLGQTGPSIPTREHLRFQLDHAQARDAVHTPLDLTLLQQGLTDRNLPHLTLRSNAKDRPTYLRRPDLGRTLHPTSIATLQAQTSVILSEAQRSEAQSKDPDTTHPPHTLPDLSPTKPPAPNTIALILADGLSAQALERHALPLLDALLPLLSPIPYHLSPATIATNARVALADEIGYLLQASITLLLIGERPGLSSPDSLGVYLTWNPRPGRTDAERNCISNIRGPQGLSYDEAAHRILHYLTEATRLQTTGTTLKDPTTIQPSLPKP